MVLKRLVWTSCKTNSWVNGDLIRLGITLNRRFGEGLRVSFRMGRQSGKGFDKKNVLEYIWQYLSFMLFLLGNKPKYRCTLNCTPVYVNVLRGWSEQTITYANVEWNGEINIQCHCLTFYIPVFDGSLSLKRNCNCLLIVIKMHKEIYCSVFPKRIRHSIDMMTYRKHINTTDHILSSGVSSWSLRHWLWSAERINVYELLAEKTF